MVAVKVWGASLRGKKVRVNCDNTTAVAAMNLARLHNKFSQAIMREISYWVQKPFLEAHNYGTLQNLAMLRIA